MFNFTQGRSMGARLLSTTTIIASLALAANTASAAQLTGNLFVSAVANGTVTVTGSTITFLPSSPTANLSVNGGNTGSFAVLNGSSSTGVVRDLNSGAANQPTGSNFVYPNFMTFALLPGVTFELDFIEHGVFSSNPAVCNTNQATAAAGQTCTPDNFATSGLSPFNLSNVSATKSTANFQVRGRVINGADIPANVSFFSGTFETTFPDKSFQQVLGQLASNGGVTSGFSGSFTVTAVPEPGSMALMGFGLAALAAVVRRRRQ